MRKINQQTGSITLFVLIAMLFFVLFLTGMYMLSTVGEQTGVSEIAKTKEIYEKNVNNIDDVYATLKDQKERRPTYNVLEIYDSTGEEEGKLHVGDFINYKAGTWTKEDTKTIKETYTQPSSLGSIPSKDFQFGGFAVGRK